MKPERQPSGPPDSVRAAAAALASRRHAELLFDAFAAQLGDTGVLETANGGAIRRLFRRDPVDPTQIVPWPVLELNIGDRFGVVTDWMPVGDVPFAAPGPQPAPPPKLRGLGPGEIRLADGDEYIEIVYNDEGARLETCRSHHPHPLAGLAPALAAEGANPIELLARFLDTLDPSRHGPSRVLMPAAMPHGAAGVWRIALRALRRALFGDHVARGACWAVADGLTVSVRRPLPLPLNSLGRPSTRGPLRPAAPAREASPPSSAVAVPRSGSRGDSAPEPGRPPGR